MIICCIFTGAILFTWLAVHNVPGTIVLVLLYGFVSGGLVSLPPATIASISKNPDELGTRVGMAFTVCSFGALVGNPVAGAMVLINGGYYKYLDPWIFAGATVMVAGLLVSLTYYLKNEDGMDDLDSDAKSDTSSTTAPHRRGRFRGLAREAFLMQSSAFAL
jgi:MFS family permease